MVARCGNLCYNDGIGEYRRVPKMVRTKKVVHVSFIDAIKNYWMGYVNFDGVATRREYWYVWLFRLAVACICVMFLTPTWYAVVWALMFLPSRALAFRRFHDAGLSGWLYLGPFVFVLVYSAIRSSMWEFMLNLEQMPRDLLVIMLMYVAYLFALLVVFVQPSKTKDNKYRK